MTRRRLGVRALPLVGLLLLVGCSGDGPDAGGAAVSGSDAASSSTAAGDESAPAPPRARPAPRPRAGACYRLSYDEALAPTTEADPVRCRRGHTAETFFVGTLDTAVGGHLLAVDSEQVRAQPAAVCPRRLLSFLGGDERALRLSVLRAVWFSPTLEQSDEGQDWFRCDVIALADSEVLSPLDVAPRRALAAAASRTAYAVCGTAEPGTRGFRRVPCGRPHRWRAISDYELSGADYPGLGRVRQIADDRCRGVGREQADDPLTFQWGFDYPTRAQWRAGLHYGLCWVPD